MPSDIKNIIFSGRNEGKICEMFSRFRATPNEAFSRRAPEQNVWIFPARHAQCDIWVFPHNLTSPLPFPSSMLKVSIQSCVQNCYGRSLTYSILAGLFGHPPQNCRVPMLPILNLLLVATPFGHLAWVLRS